ncbi:TPA: glycine cleavage system transcriptional repressor [Providencia stuartii]|uniref:glycine cleavage system transcriptional repressor n=1 Tax=Providencia stuartii TaxID=588 RepID=UPI000537DC31|nr:glycine cleavage system transcriptional repressor [Providencia stuartii]AXO17546.1 glycine cleavage system transcriptional repressor [Providencia stuartii]MBN5593319.1 glycine cleavage system transcriptional repressor [Providencia stuartii]HEM6907421.1 glycine cleavage system transcriptional repressor [Providencia stuartii]HEM6908332.1 glycine cleavage system transcriptional repressor [Providencia stuartii]HEM7154657.1 glycine cleavage system transcriptional repressor [Providencia stuartii]
MPKTEQQFLVITALGTDRPGIVNTITRLVSECDCNIEDSRLAMFGKEFTFIMMLSGSWNAIAQIEAILPLKGAELELLIVMKRTQSVQTTDYPSTVTVNVVVDDAPRIVEQFTNLFTTQQCNIAELVSKTQPASNGMPTQLEIQITAHHPLDDNGIIIKNKFQQLCTMLNAKGNISIVNNPKMQS